MTDEEFAAYLALRHELRGVEFKSSGSRDEKPFLAKVVRAMLGIANCRGGGFVILGVADTGSRLEPVGMTRGDLVTWEKYDHVADAVSAYADPNLDFGLEIRNHEGKRYVVLHVREFENVPVLCKKDYQGVLREGACYVRTRRKPETRTHFKT